LGIVFFPRFGPRNSGFLLYWRYNTVIDEGNDDGARRMPLVRIAEDGRGAAQLHRPRVFQGRPREILDLRREHGRGPRARLRGMRLRRPLRRHLETQAAGEEMTFPILVDLDDAVPIYAQIERQIRALLGSGFWKSGERLPSVRETAVRLQV